VRARDGGGVVTRGWKPGDVAMVYGPDEKWRICIRSITNDGWYDEDGEHDADIEVAHVRPLVVIDPEDREQVERLMAAFERARGESCFSADDKHLQAALRSLVAPPKPDEPTGLGAVVEDSDGFTWVRTHATGYPWHANLDTSNANNTAARKYADVAAVRVLSEGVA